MEKFEVLTGVAAPMKVVNVDTDMIIPKQFLKTIKRTGLSKGLFAGLRFNDDGTENPDFVLNKPAYRSAKILIAGDNFGCGSSREHAVITLVAAGVSAVLAESFARIFYRNGINLGLPLLVCPGIDGQVKRGDELEIDLDASLVHNKSSGKNYSLEPVSDYAMHILAAGGIKSLLRAEYSGK